MNTVHISLFTSGDYIEGMDDNNSISEGESSNKTDDEDFLVSGTFFIWLNSRKLQQCKANLIIIGLTAPGPGKQPKNTGYWEEDGKKFYTLIRKFEWIMNFYFFVLF